MFKNGKLLLSLIVLLISSNNHYCIFAIHKLHNLPCCNLGCMVKEKSQQSIDQQYFAGRQAFTVIFSVTESKKLVEGILLAGWTCLSM